MVEFKTLNIRDGEGEGEEFRSDDFLIKPEDVDTYAYAVDDHHPWYIEDSPFGGKDRASDADWPTKRCSCAIPRYIVPAGLHAKMQFEFLEPLRAGHARANARHDHRQVRAAGPPLHGHASSRPATRRPAPVLVRGQFTQMIFPESGVHRETANR